MGIVILIPIEPIEFKSPNTKKQKVPFSEDACFPTVARFGQPPKHFSKGKYM